MANDKRKRAVVDKWKKKKQFKLISPKLFGTSEFGETIATKPEQLIGRMIKLNLGILTNQIRNKNAEAFLRISKVEGSNAYTDFVGFQIKNSYLRRLFKRKTSKVELIENWTTKDKLKIKIKFVAVTYGKQEVSKVKAIRKELYGFMENFVKENSIDKILELCLDSKRLFSPLLPKLKKISRISATEVEKVKVNYK